MKKSLLVTIIASLSFSGIVQAQTRSTIISKNNCVEGVSKPDDAGFKSFEVKNGDLVNVTTLKKASGTVNLFMIAQESVGTPTTTQAFLYFSTDKPQWQDALRAAGQFKVRGLGVYNDGKKNTLQTKDTYTLSAQQDKPNGPINLTWDVFRNNQSVATFSADTKLMKWPVDIKGTQASMVTLCKSTDFTGANKEITGDWSAASDMSWNDAINSIKVPAGWKGIVYEDGPTKGKSLELTKDWVADASRKNQVSNIKVVSAGR